MTLRVFITFLNHHRFYTYLHTWISTILITLCSDCLLGYNRFLYTNHLLAYNCLLYASRLLGCNCLLYTNCQLGYNLVKSGAMLFCFCHSVMLLRYFCLFVLPLHYFSCSYFCHSIICRIHSSVGICVQRQAPTIWVTSSQVVLEWIASLWGQEIKLLPWAF
jgi:hypothetical protein